MIKELETEVSYDECTFYYRLSFVSNTEVEHIVDCIFTEIIC